MRYEFYENKYSIDRFINECLKLDFFDIIVYAEKLHAQNKKAKKFDSEYVKSIHDRYSRFVHQFLFYMENGARPHGMSDEDFEKAKSVSDKLVEKGQWTNK